MLRGPESGPPFVMPSPLLTPRKCRALFDSEAFGVLIADGSGRIVDANPFLCGLLQYTRQELSVRPLWDLGTGATVESRQAAVNELWNHGHLRINDLPLESRDGLRIHFQFRVLGHTADGLKVIECRFQDLEVGLPDPGETTSVAAPSRRIFTSQHFEQIAEQEIERTRTLGRPLSLLSIGIDRIERAQGRLAVPLALRGFAKACSAPLRVTDLVGRVDGTSFVVLLPGSAAKAARGTAERLRTAIAAIEIRAPNQRQRRLTVSIGSVTTRTGRTSYRALRSRADAKREDACSSGGNRVSV